MSLSIDFAGAVPTLCDFETLAFEYIQSQSEPLVEIRAHPETAKILDDMLNPIRLSTAEDQAEYEVLRIDRVQYRYGTFNIVRDPDFPEGVVLLT